jgi:Fe2+ transport system protein FeoA
VPLSSKAHGRGSQIALAIDVKMKTIFKMTLDALPQGVPARIGAVDAAAADLDRLEAMGLCAGRTVEVVKAGDPMIVRVLGTRIGLAAALARTVGVETECGA